MTASETVAIILWLALVSVLFVRTTPRRAVLAGLIGGWLFLPNLNVLVVGALPDLNKASITSLGLCAAVLVFDRTRILFLRPRWFDVPMLIWCIEPFITALVNGLSVYEAISSVIHNTLIWGMPYLLGRIYLTDRAGWRDLAVAIFLGGLAYLPLCWFEILAGPQLATLVYGYVPTAVETAFRFGGWRPVLFMQHGLMVAMWMTAASVSGFWLWRTGTLPRVWRVPTSIPVVVLVLTTIALKSVNAWVLLGAGLGLLWFSTRLRTTWLVWGAVALMLLYVGARGSGLWDGQELVALTNRVMASKTTSVAFRFENERQLAERAREQPILGWGRWGRAYSPDMWNDPNVAADSLWIIAFGQQGAVGLTALYAFLLLPMLFLLRRVPVPAWSQADYAPAVALAMILILYGLDGLANAMPNPIYLLGAGGLLTLRRVAADTVAHPQSVGESAPLTAPSRQT